MRLTPFCPVDRKLVAASQPSLLDYVTAERGPQGCKGKACERATQFAFLWKRTQIALQISRIYQLTFPSSPAKCGYQ